MKVFNKVLALVLSVIMVVGIAPVAAFSASTSEKVNINTESKETDVKSLKIESEDISKRDEFTKVYKLEDGTYFEVRSSSALHIKDGGKWVDAKTVFAPGKVKDVIGKCEKLTAAAKKKNAIDAEKEEKTDSEVKETTTRVQEETTAKETVEQAKEASTEQEKTQTAQDSLKEPQIELQKNTQEKEESTTEQKSDAETSEESKKTKEETTVAQKAMNENLRSSAPVVSNNSSDSELITNESNLVPVYLNDGTSGTDDNVINKYNLMLVKLQSVAPQNTNEVTISANITLELTVSGTTPGLLCAYENTESIDNVDDGDFNTFNYLTNREAHMLDLNTISNSDEYEFNITDVYNRWGKGVSINNGLTFTTLNDYTAEVESIFAVRRYKTINPFNNDSTYHTIDLGMAGMVYIDDFTNSLVLARSEIGFSNGSMPVEITRIFDYGSPDNSIDNFYGNYAHINYEGKIKKITTAANANDDDIYAWQFIDGRTIYFTLAANETTASDTNGEGFTLTKQAADYTGATIAYVNSENSAENKTYKFNKDGYLTEIASAAAVSGNDADRIRIVYIASNDTYRINYIQDGQLRRYYFNYSNYSYEYGGVSFTHRALKNITAKQKNAQGGYDTIKIDNEETICSYEYVEIGNGMLGLSTVSYPDDSQVEYSYYNGYLSTIKDVDSRRLTLNYTASTSDYSMVSNSSLTTVTQTTPTSTNKAPQVVGYTEEVLNIDDDPNSQDYQEYLLKSSLSIDSSNSYQRVFTDQTGNKEIIKYDLDLKPVFYEDTKGDAYVYQYNNSGSVENFVHIGNVEGTNEITSGDFSSALGNTDWQISSPANVKRAKLKYLEENQNYVLRMQGNIDGEATASYKVNLDGAEEGTVIVVGADAVANAPVNNSNSFFGIKVYSCSSDGSNESLLYSLPFDNTIYCQRQSKVGAFSLGSNISYIKVKLVFSQQDNLTLFDNVFCNIDTNGLVETAQPPEPNIYHQYNYNSHGMPTSHIVTNGTDYQAEGFSYNTNNFVTSHTDFNGQTTTYAYDNTSLLASKTGNYATNYTYNPIGLLKTVTNVITGIGNDPLNVSKSFSYEDNKVISVTQGNVSYNFAYDSFGNVKSINLNDLSDSTQSVAYMSSAKQDANTNVITYASGDCYKYISDNGKITQISAKRNGETEYSVVANYEYYASGKLKKLTDVAANRVITYNEDGSYKIVNGLASNFNLDELQMYSYKKLNSNTEKVNLFDLAYTYRKNEDVLENGNKKISSTLKFKNYQPALTFTNPNPGPDEPETVEMPAIEGTVTTTQASTLMEDCFGRTQSVKSTVTTSDSQDERELSGAYSYDTTSIVINGATSNLISTYNTVFKKNNNDEYNLTFYYSYDTSHRVTEISYVDNLENSPTTVLLSKYTYDVLGQLLTEYDRTFGEYNEYTYDSKGNILTKTMYDNTAFSFSDGQITHPANYSYKVLSYTYDASVYNKLTSYTLKQYDHSANSNTEVETTLQTKNLTYDALGNLNDYTAEIDGTSTNYDLCWAGDKLVLAAANNYGYSYQYDDSGRLIKKSKVDTDMIPEMEINYIWKGDLLDGYQINLFESFLTVTIKNLYDENNHIIGLNYHYAVFYGQGDQSQMSTEDFFPNDSIIWFINDGQGNVIGMYNDTGEINIGCSFDASGSGQYVVNGKYLEDLEDYYNSLYPEDPARALLQLELERARVQTVYKALSNRLFEETGYRSMIYDSDTGLIFCEGRYYSPFYSRFINANPKTVLEHQDMPFSTNLYTYCFNNPVNYKGDYEQVFDCSVDSFREIRTITWASKYFN